MGHYETARPGLERGFPRALQGRETLDFWLPGERAIGSLCGVKRPTREAHLFLLTRDRALHPATGFLLLGDAGALFAGCRRMSNYHAARTRTAGRRGVRRQGELRRSCDRALHRARRPT